MSQYNDNNQNSEAYVLAGEAGQVTAIQAKFLTQTQALQEDARLSEDTLDILTGFSQEINDVYKALVEYALEGSKNIALLMQQCERITNQDLGALTKYLQRNYKKNGLALLYRAIMNWAYEVSGVPIAQADRMQRPIVEEDDPEGADAGGEAGAAGEAAV
jgi:hypothetical protein